MFTQRHYIEIAKVLKSTEGAYSLLYPLYRTYWRKFPSLLVRKFIDLFEADNDKFEMDMFLDAIYGKEEKS